MAIACFFLTFCFTTLQTDRIKVLEDEVVSLEIALRDARMRLEKIDVELRGGHSEDSLVDKNLSYLVKYFPKKIVEAAAACALSPDVAPCYTFDGPPLAPAHAVGASNWFNPQTPPRLSLPRFGAELSLPRFAVELSLTRFAAELSLLRFGAELSQLRFAVELAGLAITVGAETACLATMLELVFSAIK